MSQNGEENLGVEGPSDLSKRIVRFGIATLVGGVAIAAIAVVALILALTNGDDTADEQPTPESSTSVPASTTSTSVVASTTTTAPATSTPVTTTPATSAPSTTQPPTGTIPFDLTPAVWPWFNATNRYDDPVAAARGFAMEFLGFEDPVVGEFAPGDSRSGEVEIRPVADGPVTLVLVRQLGSEDQWWVIGSTTENIIVTQPEVLSKNSQRIALLGRALAFEGTVQVALWVDGAELPLAETFVTGSGSEDLGDFEGILEWSPTESRWATLVFYTLDGESGQIWQATTLRIELG